MNEEQSATFDRWQVEFLPEDGGRLSRLAFDGYDLLTGSPATFRPPSSDCGRYEKRPVHGYDDCFPSVDPCRFPGQDWEVPDHGELCWLPWQVRRAEGGLIFEVGSQRIPVHFTRAMQFDGDALNWTFTVANKEDLELPVQHVMHPLMPLREIEGLELPDFGELYDEAKDEVFSSYEGSVADMLLSTERGSHRMLLLRRVSEGALNLSFRGGPSLRVVFPVAHFPTLAIWWNNESYPDADGCRRVECAFEPIPGDFSSLEKAWPSGGCLAVPARGEISWQIRWELG